MIKLDTNSWQDALYWYEDEEEVFEFMRENEDMITKYALENGMTIKAGIDYLFKLRDYRKEVDTKMSNVKLYKLYKCPKCNEYGDTKSWDEETIKHYEEEEHDWVLSINHNDKNNCEYYCPNCKLRTDGKYI